MAIFDEKNNLWRSLNQHPFDDGEKSPGQQILDTLSAQSSKVAQVFQLIRKKSLDFLNLYKNMISIR